MKKLSLKMCKLVLALACLFLLSLQMKAQTYTSVYNGVHYSSVRPYNLNVVYFVPSDIPLDPTYKKRLSAILLWGQNYFMQNMINNGYGPKTFGLFKETANRDNVKIILIHGQHPDSAYTYKDRGTMDEEIKNYFTNNPSQKGSQHTLVITAVKDQAHPDAPFYGMSRTAYAIDYPQFDIKYIGTDTYTFTGWFGGLMHELGHGLNLAHSAETKTEHNDPNKGITLMSFGNMSLGKSPVFINRAKCAVLNNCEVFKDAPGLPYYNGHKASITSLRAKYINGNLVVSGKFQSDRLVKDVNFFQNPNATDILSNNAIAWSVSPNGNTFSVQMPVSELTYTNQNYSLIIQLVLENGEGQLGIYKFSYVNGIPQLNIDFDTVTNCLDSSFQLSTDIQGSSYQWQYQNPDGTWSNHHDGNTGYADFSGTKTKTMTISGMTSYYLDNSGKARVAITHANGSITYSQNWIWDAKEGIKITKQPAANTTACVGDEIQLSAEVSDSEGVYQWQYQNPNGTWSNYQEDGSNGYANFSGTKTKTMTISDITNYYLNNIRQARLLITAANGCTTISKTANWTAKEKVTITTQPAANTTACVGGSIQLSAEASDADAAYQWQYQNPNGSWSNYQEDGSNGYANFSGTKTKTMTISNISNYYLNNLREARVLITGSSGCTEISNTAKWKATNCTSKSSSTDDNLIEIPANDQSVYPNPVKDELTVDLGPSKDKYQVEVINNLRLTIYKTVTSDKTLKIPFADKLTGTYLITIKDISKGTIKSFHVIKK